MEDLGTRDERAQIILIGAFLIAIGVLSALLIINDIGFSQTIATQDGGEDSFEALEFSSGAERAVSEAMTGNGSDPSNASVEFEEYIQSYSTESNDAVLTGGARANITIPDPNNDVNPAWMVGQRKNGNFTNAKGDDEWIMVEEIPSPNDNNIRGRFEFNVTEMEQAPPNQEDFALEATESGTFADLDTSDPLADGNIGNVGWNLTAKINDTGGDTFLVLNLTEFEIQNAPPNNISIINEKTADPKVTGQKTVTVDVFNETVDSDTDKFPDFSSGRDATDARGFKIERASNGKDNGTYEFRFDPDGGSGVTETELDSSSTGDPKGPCTHPDGLPCRSTSSTEKHIVGVVHNVTDGVADIEYVSRSTSYESTIGPMTLDAEDVNLDEIENVDGAASFNIRILDTNSPAVEDSSPDDLQIRYEVENTGTVNATQEILLEIPAADPDPSVIANGSQNNPDDTQDGVVVEPLTTRVSDGGSVVGSNDINNVSWGEDGATSNEIAAGKNGTYTAFVVSENSTTGESTVDSVVISVDKNSGDPGIPDSPVGFALPLPSWDAVAEAAVTEEVFAR